ncbi:uncharacterized protein N7483_009714 [Penicillium malachiteum]|uniref:uncharacterized protein n=1 Tax=Penicillium malachiteum TaxID=1324776 RepID=UPI00254717CB|nr:uncharacterized protein N7483_009714 [Penicillium malachiteum]KAJ5721780.1 hypothetical protein N7483_009714 [Penicillium malachiteum]
MAGAAKRSMPGNSDSSKRRKGEWKQQRSRNDIESGEIGVFVTCEKGKESKCCAEVTDIFSDIIEKSAEHGADEDSDSDDADIEAQIQRELEGLSASKKKSRPVQTMQLDMPCVIFARLNDKSVDPVELVHKLCVDAQANPDKKQSRFIKRLTPITMIRKTLSVDLEAFAKEILKPHFHSGGPPKKYAIRPTVRGNSKINRDTIIKTVADAVGPEHPVDLKNYDLTILVDVVQNVIGMSVVGSDYDDLKRYNIAEIYEPSPKGQATPAKTEREPEVKP